MVVWVLLFHLAGQPADIFPTMTFKNQDDCFDVLQHLNDNLTKGPPYLGDCFAFAADKIPADPTGK